MPTRPQLPSYRLHKASGQAVVTLDGRDFYLGRHETQASRAKYERLIAEYLARGRRMPAPGEDGRLTVAELCLSFFDWAQEEYHLPDGRQSREVANVRIALRPLLDMFLGTPAEEFGPLDLKAYRDGLLAEGHLARSTINQRVQIVRRVFRWGAEMEVVPASVIHALEAVRGLRRGRSGARETKPVQPVPEAHIAKALEHMPPLIAAMVELQLLTAMRPGEVVVLKPCDIDMRDDIWVYKPESHKNAWRGLDRPVAIGPKAQAVITPLLRPGLQGRYLFSPKETVRWQRQRMHETVDSDGPNTTRAPRRIASNTSKRPPRDHYDTSSYAQAIRRACKRANVPIWTPGRLRHNAATETRRRFGIEAASAVLGHHRVDTTEIYSDVRSETAARVAKEIG